MIPEDNYTSREATASQLFIPAAEIKRVALVFDDQTRPETTGFYCRRALEKLVEVTFFHPSALAEVPREAFDLYLNIDDVMRYQWPADLHPCAWWAIDTHIDFA